MYDVKYTCIIVKNVFSVYNIPVLDNPLCIKAVAIHEFYPTASSLNSLEYLNLYYCKMSEDRMMEMVEPIDDILQISQLHGELFRLLIANIDAIKTTKGEAGLVLDKKCFYEHILPEMERLW